MLAKVPGHAISDGARLLPAANELQQAERSVALDVAGLGSVRITYRLNSYQHRRNRFWHWLAVRAEAVSSPE